MKHLLAMLILLSLCPQLLANGGYKPTIEVAASPTIPVQRALITFRDGVETLIVESTFQTPSREVVWILPLPAEPTSLTKADSGLLETLSIQLQPKIITTSAIPWTLILAAALLVIPLAFTRFMTQERLSIVSVIGIALIGWVIGMVVFMPALGRARSSAGGGAGTEPGVAILDSLRVGNYDSKILRADSASALADYLAMHKLQPLSASEKKIFDQYIAEGWCFVLSQLHQDAAGAPATPHPICATFPTKAPIFPMRATAMAGSTTHVELFIATNGHADAPGFVTVLSQGMHPGESYRSSYPNTTFTSYYGPPISHPDLKDLLWNACTVTKLTADLTPAQMDRDIAISTSTYRGPYRQSLYSTGLRNEWIAAAACVISTMLLCWLSVAQRPTSLEMKRIRHKRISRATGFGAAVCAGIYLFFPAIPTITIPSFRANNDRSRQLFVAARQAISDGKLNASLLQSPEKLADMLKPYVREEMLINPYTGQPIAFRRSPGNYDLYQQSGQVYLNLLPAFGTGYSIPLPASRTTSPATQPT